MASAACVAIFVVVHLAMPCVSLLGVNHRLHEAVIGSDGKLEVSDSDSNIGPSSHAQNVNASLLQKSAKNPPSEILKVPKELSCAHMSSTGGDHMLCIDGFRCLPERHGWDCCNSHGGRKQCPANYPKMCSRTCGHSDNCCDIDCATYGGLRSCHGAACDEDIEGFRADTYHGCQNFTRSGRPCQRWDSMVPHNHTIQQADYPNADLRENYCRNPTNELSIWCFTNVTTMRWEFCDPLTQWNVDHVAEGRKCQVNLPLVGSKQHPRLSDDRITASSYFSSLSSSGLGQMWRSRMESGNLTAYGTWSAETGDREPWIQWDFEKPKLVHSVQTKGGQGEEWVSWYKLAFSADGNSWTILDPKFEGNSDANTIMENAIDPPIIARMVRMYPIAFHERVSARVELFGCSAPASLVISYPTSECASSADGRGGDRAMEQPSLMSWESCHNKCQQEPRCIGFQYGIFLADDDNSRCKQEDLCSCWFVVGSCAAQVPNPSYHAYLFNQPVTSMRLVDDTFQTSTSNASSLNVTLPRLRHKGRLDVLHNGQWGTVCNDLFDDSAAKVACRQLNYKGGRLLPPGSMPRGSGPIWLDNIRCAGDEHELWFCNSLGWGRHNCDHDADVAIECSPTDEE